MIANPRFFALLGFLLFSFTGNSNGDLIITATQVGGNVELETSGGSLNLAGLFSPFGSSNRPPSIKPNTSPGFLIGDGPDDVDQYVFVSNFPSSMGTGGETIATSGTGPMVGVLGNSLFVQSGYVSGATLAPSTATFENTTFADLGLDVGTYVWSWNSGAESITIQTAIPEPSPVLLLSLTGCVGCFVVRVRRCLMNRNLGLRRS